mmetsp:Transcript_92645/g.215278  ORF Transcript_92645/g.215278 Transcript_92645/m.215278 type:complete len:231 (-) Transcript_92645:134-826(-)
MAAGPLSCGYGSPMTIARQAPAVATLVPPQLSSGAPPAPTATARFPAQMVPGQHVPPQSFAPVHMSPPAAVHGRAPFQLLPPGSRVRLKGVSADSPLAGEVLVVTSDPPDFSGQLRVRPESGGSTALLISPVLLEAVDGAPPPQLPAPPLPATWLEGGAEVSRGGLRVGDQVRLRGHAANKQYEGKVLTVEAADVGDGTGRARVVVRHETHVSRLAIDPAHLEAVGVLAS